MLTNANANKRKLRSLLILLVLLISGCTSSYSPSSVNQSEGIRISPIQLFQKASDDGWQKLNVSFAVANTDTNWHFFMFNQNYQAAYTSAQSREENVQWTGSFRGSQFPLPPGFIVRSGDPQYIEYSPDLEAKIPRNMTGIVIDVPFVDRFFEYGDHVAYYPEHISANNHVSFNLPNDVIDPSSLSFPVFDESLLSSIKLLTPVAHSNSKLSLNFFSAQRDGDVLHLITDIRNTNTLAEADWRINLYAAGDNGLVVEGRGFKTEGCYQFSKYHPIKLSMGPGQSIRCTFAFQISPAIRNIYVWYVITHSPSDGNNATELIDDYGVVKISE